MIQKKAPEGVEPVVKTRQAQLHPWHAAADITSTVCVRVFIELCRKLSLQKSPGILRYVSKLLTNQVPSVKSRFHPVCACGSWDWRHSAAVGLLVTREGFCDLTPTALPYLNTEHSREGLERDKRVVPASMKYFCSKHS